MSAVVDDLGSIAAIVGTTCSLTVVTTLWITSQIRRIEQNMYRQFSRSKDEVDRRFEERRLSVEREFDKRDATFKDHSERVQRLEFYTFGITNTGTRIPESYPDKTIPVSRK